MVQFTHFYQFSVYLIFLLSRVSAQTVQSIVWVVPDGSFPDLTQTFANGETLPLAWNPWNSTDYVDTTKNLVDLWVTAFDFALNPYSQRLAVGLNLTSPGTFAWTIAIPNGNLSVSAKYVLRFKIISPVFDLNDGDLSSPGFLVLQAAAMSSVSSMRMTSTPTPNPSSSISISSTMMIPQTTASAPANSSSPSATPPSGLSVGAKGGIGAGLVIGILGMAALLYFIFFVRRKKAESTDTSAEKGPEEQSRDPVEMPAKMVVVELPGDDKRQHMYQANY